MANEFTKILNDLNWKLEENRKKSERLKGLSDQLHKEIEENKEDRIKIEKDLDKVYFQITQKNLS